MQRFDRVKSLLGSLWPILLIPLAIVWVSCHPNLPISLDFDIEIHELENGLDVVLVKSGSSPVISYQTWYRVGSVDEKFGFTGLSHLFEHLMFKGTKAYGPRQFFFQLEAKGAEVNAFTTRDYTVFYENFTPNLLDKAIEMESDRMHNLILDAETLRSERQVVFEERRMRTENSPSGKVQEALWLLAYDRHPYRNPVVGFPQDLLQITVKKLKQFYGTYYQPANATVVVTGAIDPDQTFKKIKQAYEKIPSRPQPIREVKKEPKQQSEKRLRLFDNVATPQFSEAYHISKAAEPDSYALDVLSNILFAGRNARAMKALVEEKQLLLSLSGTSFTPTYPGLFILTGVLREGVKIDEVEQALSDVFDGVKKNGVTKEEIQVAIRQLAVELVDGVRTPHGLGQLLGTVHTILGDAKRYKEDLQNYLKVTPEEVQGVAQKYLYPNNRTSVVLFPEEFQNAEGKGKF